MNITTFLSRMDNAGDAYIFFKTSNSPREKYHIGTLDFTNNNYINSKKAQESYKTREVPDNHVKVFCWDADAFKLLDVQNITKVIPLGVIIKQNPNMRT